MNQVKTETRRDQIIAFIAEYAVTHHNAPSTYEIAEAFQISQQTAYIHMVKLLAEQRLTQVDGRWKIPGADYTPPVNL
jgi:DeoR/GlpR family transcriptional regulator of sugar metabolism